MAGVVAMASVIEDFDTQPCKKTRKEDGSPVVKTITNYFSPVPKPEEKPFSPPRSNNIMDYFSRKTLSSKEKTSSPEQSKENCRTSQLAEKYTSPEVAVKKPSQKRSRKASKAARRLVEAETISFTEEPSCLIVEEPHDGRDSAAEVISSCGVFGSDTGALMTVGKSDRNVTNTVSVEQADEDEDGSKCGNAVKLNPELNSIELSPIVLSKDKAKQVKTVAQTCRKAKHSEPEEKESSLCDVSMEVNVDEASLLNNSTVTISFEDFVRNQGKGEEDIEDEQGEEHESKITTEAEEIDAKELDKPKAEENVCSGESPYQVSPRTLTIQAEVHVVSSKQEAAKAGGKLASIFNRRKGAMSPVEVVSSPHIEAGHQLPSTSLNVKRKSNVVLQEEDLELAVLESESMPKCSEAVKKQFMSAFKQPSLDGSKTKPGKSQGKQKQAGEKALDDADKVVEEDSVTLLSVEQVPAASQENNIATNKPQRKGRKKAKEEEAAAEETVATVVEVDDEREEPPITSTPSIPAVRRSRREAVVRQTPEATPTTLIRKTRKRNKSKDAAAALPNDCPPNVSTPKLHKSKHGVFVAEVVCSPDTKESPIRIRFTRVHKKVSMTKAESGINTFLATKTSKDSKKIKQAKKLVEKARVIQQSKKTAVKEKGTLRRSSRTEASDKRSYCEDEDSVICLEDDQTAAPQTAAGKRKTQKHLRSLNEVLGKATSVGKEAKAVPGSKEKKVSAVISIFDESDSENSQDGEQFRARREFLKSGLPESFRKQIVRTAANKEAYSLSCSSFQPVVHMTQQPKDCPLWSLLWPESLLLRHLKELWGQTSSPLPSVSGSLCVKTEPARRAFCERGSGWRPEISESVRQLLMEEVSTSNPSFPVEMFITRFLKRRADHQQQCTASEPEAVTRVTSTTQPAEPVGGKRKRMDEAVEMTAKVAKKQRADCAEENVSELEPTRRAGRMRRAQRSRTEEGENEKAKPPVITAPTPSEDDSVIEIEDFLFGENTGKKDVVKEDVLWTDKYQPQHSSDILGNTASVSRLHSWLKEWKLRADREERKNQKDNKKQEECGNDSDWECGEVDYQDGEDMLCNTMLITGPTGVGKTAAVYACAQELGFKVFEVNASSQRSGRLILSQLKEATQSHQVDSQGVNAHKPTYFNSYGTSSSAGTLKPGSSPKKFNSPRRVVSSPRKPPQSPRGARRGGLAPTSLANFFKRGRPTTKETPDTKKSDQAAASKKVIKANECTVKHQDPAVKSPTATTPKEKHNEEPSKKTATSLILFEEVDVIFDDDSGFLAAIKTFMTTTKRPVILTTSDPAFSTMFDGNFEEIHFKTPSVLDVSSFLRLLCLTEDVRTDLLDISSLLRLNGCDIRQSLLQLQFWTRSAGGRHVTRPLTQTGKNAELKPETDEEEAGVTVPSTIPPCDTGCTESMLGLLNVEPERDIWELLKSPAEETLCWELLTNSKRRGVDLLYSNMETLLPLPLTQLTTSTYKPKQSVSAPQDHPVDPKELPSDGRLLHTAESVDFSDDSSPVKMSNRMRKNKKSHCLPDQDGLHSDSDSDSEEGFLCLSKPECAPLVKEEVKESLVSETVKRKPLTPEERVKSLPVSQCLDSIAEFLDNMSHMDSLLVHPEGVDNHRNMSPVGAVVKDGMTDESRLETDRGSWVRGEHVSEIPAAVEALSFHKCRVSSAEAWNKAHQLEGELGKEAAAEFALPVAAHREGYSFSQDGPCQPQLVQQRREVMESLMFRGVFGTLGNRSAAALDYLPALRTICRSEQLKEQGKVKRRFLHYLDGIHLGLDKSTLQHLAEDFP
ncbi:ATPase family AAA domain-containing protein 5 [Cottoperca gobio]|uniref:ATPase family AAA domain-containing protein 5 n=1 Tax=Cottoperca gobio TaxID=56716 RepID=A0A6J2Q6W2_COTGO|nr:ATPase family AAA domain-containing protein 5 [Cottoperca gobio]XP_029293539.1 ATPase family AAA domain-containing protein 5 [Cottoperca gobio]